MAIDDKGREGRSAGAMAKELGISPAKVKKTLVGLGIEPDFVKSNCGYYYVERTEQVKRELAKA
jgi:predicted ArsR family transcriptional regulator